MKEANAGIVLQIPYEQFRLDSALKELVDCSRKRKEYKYNAKQFSERVDLYSMVDVIVDKIENFHLTNCIKEEK